MLAAQAVYDRLLAENGGHSPSQPWAEVKRRMTANPKTRHLVKHLPKRLDLALKRTRKARLIKGRPLKAAIRQ